jgi:hypothetical protein
MKPMKNLIQSVSRRVKIVTVALTIPGTPKITSNVVRVISGRPTSKGIPIGRDLTATKIDVTTMIETQLIWVYPTARNVK